MTADTPLQRWIGRALRYATAISVVLIAAGLMLAMTARPDPLAHDATPLVDRLAGGGPMAVLAVGVLMLSLVPMAALVAALVLFVRARERGYAAATLAALGLLIGSLAVSAAVFGAN